MQTNKSAEWVPKPGVSKETLARVQKRLFEMAVATRDILESHDIPYMIAFGTLLGAVRHNGFVPWDDDFDMYLFNDSYGDALNVLREELPPGMFVEDELTEPMYFHGWAHVKDLGSEASCGMYAHDSCYAHKGVHLDLYRAVEVRRGALNQHLRNENLAYINRRRSKGLMSDEEYERRMERLDVIVGCCPGAEGSDDLGYALIAPYKYKFMLKKDVFPMKRYLFNGTEFFGPQEGERILSFTYGDFMEYPPLEKRQPKYDSVVFFG